LNDFYQILGVDPRASQSEIKRAYREVIKKYHPDLNRSRNATEKTQKVTEAYSVLSDAIKKAEYDQIRAFKKARASDASQQQTASGVHPKSSTPPPQESAPPRQEKCRCQRCGAIDPTLRVVVFTWVISLLIFSFKRGWAGILCRKCQVKYAFLFNCELAFLGIWGFPWGIIWTIQGLWNNLQGGIQPAENNALLLSSLGYQFFSEGRYEEAAIAFQESLKFKRNPDVTQILSECERKFTPKEKRFADKFVGFDLPTWTYNYAILLAAIVTFACGVRVGAFFLLGGGGLFFSYEGLHRWYSRPRPGKKGASSAKRPGTRPRSKSLKMIYSCIGYAMLILPIFLLLYGMIKRHGLIQPSNPPSSPPASIADQTKADPAQSPGPQKAHASYDIWSAPETMYYAGIDCYNGKDTPQDYSCALGFFLDAAGKGYAPAQYMVGVMYFNGQGTTQDYSQALEWYQKAADQGCASAQCNLGLMYGEGKGINQDYSQAVKWYQKAADQGCASAQSNLGAMYYGGYGTTQDYDQAMKWYQRAAYQGNALAQSAIGNLYQHGQGVIKDELEALAWYNVAASQGDNSAVNLRDGLETNLGTQNALIAQQRAREILRQIKTKQSAVQNNSTAPSDTAVASDPPKSSGSGVVVSSTGLILTAAHVVTDSSKFSVITANGTKSAKVVQIDTANDVALLQCDGTFTPVPVRPSQSVKLGEPVFTIGFPDILVQGFSPKMTRGDISSLSGIQDDIRDWQISVPVQPGNSGGGLFDKHGNLVGLVVMKLNAVKVAAATGDVPQNVNYAVKSYYFMPLLDAQSVTPSPMRTDSTGDEKIEDVVARVQNSVVLILAY